MRSEKAEIVKDLATRLSKSSFVFVADYEGVDMAELTELRDRMYRARARFTVVKNTFLRLAVQQASLPEFCELVGQTAIVTGSDAAAAAKELIKFTRDFKKLKVKGGVLECRVASAEEIQLLADLPLREVLLAKLLGLLNQPATMLLRVLNEPSTRLARVLKARTPNQD